MVGPRPVFLPSRGRSRARISAALVSLALGLLPWTAAAQARLADLASDDPDVVMLAIESLARHPRPGAAAALATRIRQGLPEAHLLAAVSALSAFRDRAAAPVLFELLAHRRATVRRLAVEGLVVLRGPGVEAALRDALSDRDRSVREAAITGLDEIAGPSSVPTLLAALEHGHLGALGPLARLAGDAEVPRLLERIGRVPLDTLAPALTTLVLRRNLEDATRIAVVTALADLGTTAARALLESMRDGLPPRREAAVRSALDGAIARLPG